MPNNGKMINYTYTATGAKIRQQLETTDGKGGTSTRRDYAGSFVFENNAPGWFSTPHGRFVLDGTWKNEFHLRDHLGNNRVVLMEEDTGTLATLQQNHYYPFGMLIPSLSTSNTIGALKDNRYLYNGKEFNDDFDLDWYVYPVFIGNYGVKFYDAQIGRFHTQDRFAEKYLSWTPYQYGGNNPISFIDINGDSIWYVNPMGIVTHSEIGARNYAGTHTLYALNDKGEKTGDPINVKDGSILDQLATDRPETKRDRNKIYHDYFPDGVRYAETTYREETFKLFHFFANHTEVEWAINGFITEGMKDYIIATGHSERFAPNPWYGDDGKFPGRDLRTLNFRIHSHQAHNSLGGGPSSGDKDGWRDIRTRLGSFREPPPHYVYEVKEQRLYWYGGYSGQKGVTRLTIRHFSDLYRHLGF